MGAFVGGEFVVTFGSLFTGAGGADIGLEQAGLTPLFHAEIDAHASNVLRYHHPDVPNFGDITQLDPAQLPNVDVLWMSPPCQDLSVAGRRKGLEGERSGLFYDAVRIARDLVRRGTRFVLMEQVPGLFSSHGGEDFRRVLLEFLELRPSDIGWRVLDTQWFDPPQRRERIFFVLDFGGKCAEPVLSLAESMCGYPAPRREAGQGAARSVARSLRARGTGSNAEDLDTYIPDVAGTFQANNGGGGRGSNVDDAASGYMIPDVRATLAGHGGGANEPARFGAIIPFDTTQITSKDNRSTPKAGDPMHPIQASAHAPTIAQAFTVREDATAANGGNFHAKETDVALTIGAQQPGEQLHHAQLFIAEALSFGWNKSPSQTMRVDNDTTDALQASSTSNPAVVQVQWASGGGKLENDTAQALRSGAEANYQFLRGNFGVRRLTPRECERCQGWPDDRTRWGRKEDGTVYEVSDTQRYKMIGNGVSSPISKWIAQNLLEAVAAERGAA